jgi:hypothetical protein
MYGRGIGFGIRRCGGWLGSIRCVRVVQCGYDRSVVLRSFRYRYRGEILLSLPHWSVVSALVFVTLFYPDPSNIGMAGSF